MSLSADTLATVRTAAAAAAALALAAFALSRALLGSPKPEEFALACACGRVRATVRAPAPMHLTCHCGDCQAYVAWCATQRPPEAPVGRSAVDERGGVRCCQVFKADISLTTATARGLLQVTCLDPRLVPEGRPFTLVRVHATCCGTPLFNTWPELPTCSFFASAAVLADGGSGAAALRVPPQWRLNTKWTTPAAPGAPPLVPAGSVGFSPFFLLRFMARNLVFYTDRAVPAPFLLPALKDCPVRSGGAA